VTFLGAPLSVLGPAAAGLGAAVVGLYLLRLRRRRLPVPFAALWQRVLADHRSTALHRRLRQLLSLAVQLVLLALILGAIADPRLSASRGGRTLVLLVDVSASMQARDVDGAPRLERAKKEARRILATRAADDTALVLPLDGRPTPTGGLSADDRELEDQLAALTATDAPADPERALRVAADALFGRPNPTLIWIGDGAYDPDALARMSPPPGVDLRFVPVGPPAGHSDNLAVTAFAVRRYRANQTAYEVLVEVTSFSARKEAVRLELYQEGEPVEAERLELEPGARTERLYPNLAGAGARLEARLQRADGGSGPLDALALDDRAYAVLPARKKERVLLVTTGNLFLEGALLLDQNLTVEKIAPAAWDPARAARVDAVVLDRFTPPQPPEAHALYVDPAGPASPFPIRGELLAPYVTDMAQGHPLTRWVALKDLNMARASRFQLAPGDVAIASSLRAPIIAARERAGRRTLALGFPLERSDLVLRVAFPVLLTNALEWFAGGDAGVVDAYPTGQPLRLRVRAAGSAGAALRVRAPDGAEVAVPLQDGRAAYYAEHAGFHTLLGDGAPRLFACNLESALESRLDAPRELRLGGAVVPPAEPGRARVGLRRALWPLLVALALFVAVLEWLTYHRRVTV
jgi:hypothetical protein